MAATAVPLATLEHWASVTSLEPFAATLLVGDDGESEITVNARLVVTRRDHARVERWVADEAAKGTRLAFMDEVVARC